MGCPNLQEALQAQALVSQMALHSLRMLLSQATYLSVKKHSYAFDKL